MTSVLVIAEFHQGELAKSTLSTLAAAHEIAENCDVLVMGPDATWSNQLMGFANIAKILSATVENPLAEPLANIILTIAQDYTHILAPASTFGKNLLPRVAAKLDVMQISDVIKIESEDVFERPIYAGNALLTLRSTDPIQVLTIRATAFEPVKPANHQAEVKTLSVDAAFKERSHFVAFEPSLTERPELSAANIVVSGGRGLKSKENFALIEQLADCLGAAVGATRAAVDAGFVPNDYQVGQTGKVVAPSLYWAIGISGAIQHIAGILDSKIIVAINKDPDAPIFEVADYGLVGDLFEILPTLIKKIQSPI